MTIFGRRRTAASSLASLAHLEPLLSPPCLLLLLSLLLLEIRYKTGSGDGSFDETFDDTFDDTFDESTLDKSTFLLSSIAKWICGWQTSGIVNGTVSVFFWHPDKMRPRGAKEREFIVARASLVE